MAGIDHIGIGADFYDVDSNSMVAGLEDVTRYPYLFAELLHRGYSDDDVLNCRKKPSSRHAPDGEGGGGTAEVGGAAYHGRVEGEVGAVIRHVPKC